LGIRGSIMILDRHKQKGKFYKYILVKYALGVERSEIPSNYLCALLSSEHDMLSDLVLIFSECLSSIAYFSNFDLFFHNALLKGETSKKTMSIYVCIF